LSPVERKTTNPKAKMKTIQIPVIQPGAKVLNPNMAGILEVVRRVRKNVYEVRLPADFHQPQFAGKTIEMQRNQITPA
jgi:hypothetical protein